MLKHLPFLILAPLATADVHSSTAWAEVAEGNTLVHFHLDDQTGVLSVRADYSGLQGHLIEVRLEDGAGNLWLSVPHDGGTEGSVAGNVVLTPTQVREALTPQGRIVFYTAATPSDEIVAHINLNLIHPSTSFPIGGDQVVGGTGESAITGTGSIKILNDQVVLSGNASGLGSRITSIELRGPAWHGETGPLIAEVSTVLQTREAASFLHYLNDPSPQLLEDLRDGLTYFLVKTEGHPNGAARGQGFDGKLGQEFCHASPTSASFHTWLQLRGSVRAADNDVTLYGSIPPNRPVLPLVGTGTMVSKPSGSDGYLCLGGGPIGRLTSEFGFSDSIGLFTASPDLTRLPFSGAQALQPGDTLTFQLWYRDHDPEPTSNFSSAVWVRFR